MKIILRNLARNSKLYWIYQNFKERRIEAREMCLWETANRPLPIPHLSKQRALYRLASENSAQTFVETGTYLGQMVEAMSAKFSKIYSVELSIDYARRATSRFKRNKNVQICQGDSAVVLSKIIPLLQGTVLFWLDGHYSAGATAKGTLETPILQELRIILSSSTGFRPIIAIDDARCFDGTHDYPTKEKLREFIDGISMNPLVVHEENDMFVIKSRGDNS